MHSPLLSYLLYLQLKIQALLANWKAENTKKYNYIFSFFGIFPLPSPHKYKKSGPMFCHMLVSTCSTYIYLKAKTLDGPPTIKLINF